MSYSTPTPESLLEDHTWMRRLALSLLRDSSAAEDLVQDTWLAALKRWPGGKPTRAWLARVLRNGAISRYRRQGRHGEEPSPVGDVAGEDGDPVARLEAQQLVAAAVLELEEPMRTILLLRYQDGMQPQEIAERLEIPAGTVRSRLSRGLRLLRGRLEQRCGGDPRLMLMPLVGTSLPAPIAPLPSASPAQVLEGATGLSLPMLGGGLALSGLAVYVCFVQVQATGPVAGNLAAQVSRVPPLQGSKAEAEPVGADVERRVGIDKIVFGTAPGWWLQGTIRGGRGLGATGGTLRIADFDHLDEPVRGRLLPNGRAEADVGELFRHADRWVSALHVRVDHPDYLPAHVKIPVGRRQRQDGFDGGRVALPFDIELTPATALFKGVVEAPPSHGGTSLRVGLFQTSKNLSPVDDQPVAADGSFQLRGVRGKRYQVVAWSVDPARPLLPASREVADADLDRRLSLRLEPGESVSGILSGAKGVRGLRIRLSDDSSSDAASSLRLVSGMFAKAAETEEQIAMRFESLAQDISSSRDSVPGPGPAVLIPAPFDQLSVRGEQFVHRQIHAVVDEVGRFSAQGFAKGQRCRMHGVLLVTDGESVPIGHVGKRRGLALRDPFDTSILTTKRRSVTAPAANWMLRFAGRPQFLRFVGPQPPRAWSYRIESVDGHVPRSADGSILEFRASAGGRSLLVDEPGSGPKEWTLGAMHGVRATVRIESEPRLELAAEPRRSWVEVPLVEIPNRGGLRLRVEDVGKRWAEAVRLVLRPRAKDGALGEPLRLPGPTHWRRVDPPISIQGIPPGSYRLTWISCDRRGEADRTAFVVDGSCDVEIRPGLSARYTLRMTRGGRLRVTSALELVRRLGLPLESKEICARVLQGSGRPLPGQFIHADWSWDGRVLDSKETLPTGVDLEWSHTLAPGKYVLESWSKDLSVGVRRTEFEIRAGATTVLPSRR